MKTATVVWAGDNIGGREEQQDRVICLKGGDGSCLLVVADGMGGHRGGALAAEAVIGTAREMWQACRGAIRDPAAFLTTLAARAHDAVNQVGQAHGLSPRSTMVALHLDGRRATWAHVGDSRLYRFHRGTFIDRTRDHSIVQMMVDMGEIGEAEMTTHPDQNKVTRSVGGDKPWEPTVGSETLRNGDAFLLCSDGFWESCGVPEMLTGLDAVSLEKSLPLLLQLAATRGGPKGDNIALAVARTTGYARRGPLAALRNLLGSAILLGILMGIGAGGTVGFAMVRLLEGPAVLDTSSAGKLDPSWFERARARVKAMFSDTPAEQQGDAPR